MFSSTSFADWTKVDESEIGNHYVDFDKIRKYDGFVYFWTLFAAFSPGIIAYTIHQKVQKSLGASTTGFILYLFAIFGAKFF